MARDDLEGRIDDGMTLVLDRYACSGVAYTSAKGLPLEWCKAPDGGLPKPDLTIFLDVPIEGSSSRDGFGEERYEKRDFQVMVRKRFDQLKDDTWIVQRQPSLWFIGSLWMVLEVLRRLS
jgi:dTMP kinase